MPEPTTENERLLKSERKERLLRNVLISDLKYKLNFNYLVFLYM